MLGSPTGAPTGVYILEFSKCVVAIYHFMISAMFCLNVHFSLCASRLEVRHFSVLFLINNTQSGLPFVLKAVKLFETDWVGLNVSRFADRGRRCSLESICTSRCFAWCVSSGVQGICGAWGDYDEMFGQGIWGRHRCGRKGCSSDGSRSRRCALA